jgi:hypothetical protein
VVEPLPGTAPQEGLSLLLIHAQAPHRKSLARAENAFSVSVSGLDGYKLPCARELLAQAIFSAALLPGRLWPRVQPPPVLGAEPFLI